jgi:CARDB/SdrD B-like domain
VPLMSAEKYFIQISTSNTNNMDFENNLIFDNYNKPILDGNLGMGAVGIYKFDLETLLSQYKSRGHTHEPQLRENQSYYWRIRAESSFNRGGSGPWSVVWEFKKRTVLKPKTMVPMSGQQCVDTTPGLIWHTDDNIPVRYHLQYSGNNASIDTIISSSYFQIQSPLKPKSKYYWRVWAESAEYGTSEMALDSFVTTESRPEAPSLLYPASHPVNRTTGKLLTDGDQPIDVDIRWNNTRPDYNYEMEVSEFPDFSVINLPYLDVQPWLTYGKTYYWRVRFVTKDCHVPGEWSNPIIFTTKKPVPEFELSNTRIDVEPQSSAQGTIRIVNRSPYSYDLTIFTNSTTSGLEISPSVQNISLNALGQADVTLNLTAGNVATGDYYASFRIESREHDAILTNKLRLCVLPAGSLILPDLEIASEDIKTIVDAQGKSTAVSFDLHNRGGSSAIDVHYYCFDFDKLISEGSVSAIHRDERHTIEIPIEVGSTGDGNHLIRVLIDPENLIRERDKTNNEASQTFSPQDSGSNFSGGIAINAFIPTVVYSGDGFIISGSANYDITIDGVRYTDYMVKGARVEVSLDGIQANSGHTTADGDFALPFIAPSSPGKYSGRMTVSDRTFTATKQFVITVEPRQSITPPPPSYPINGTPNGGSWVPDSSGEIKWISHDGTYIETRNVSIYSEDISFSNDNPSSGDTVSICAVVRSWGSNSALPAQNIPVTLLATRLGSGATTIGKLLIKNVGPLDSRTVTTSCIFKQDGVYIIEADISSTLQDDNPGDDAATRAIIVGHIRSSSGVASGQVIGPEGGMSGIEIQIYDSTGTTLVSSTLSGDKGTFLFDILQIGTYQVRCIVPSQYTCDTAQRTITIVDQKVTQFNFVLGSKAEEKDTSAPVPVIAHLPDIKNQCSARISEIPAAQDNHDGLVIGFTNDPVEYSVQGTYFIRWNFRDSAGNTTFQTQKVVIEDTIAPVPDIMQLPVITGTEMVPVSVTTVPEATDNCVGKIRGTTTQVLTYTNPGTYTITWTYDDGHGNQSNQLQTVVVVPCIKNLTARGKLNQVQLTWTNNGTAPYRIFRSVIGSDRGFVQIATTVSTSSTYLDIGLTPGTTYWYYITSDNSCPSNVVEYVLTGRVIR